MEREKIIKMLEDKTKSKYVRYQAEQKPTTCGECQKNNNNVFRRTDVNLPTLPVHPNCKCKLIDISDENLIKTLDVSFGVIDNRKELTNKPMKGYVGKHFDKIDNEIARVVAEFNANKAAWVGCTEEQAKQIPDMTASLLKSHFIQESGGSSSAWLKDPGQVNNSGDWVPEKSTLGINPPSSTNTDSLYTNIRAALIGLARKGFGASYIPVNPRRKSAYFDGWEIALQRYNVGDGETIDGRPVAHEYARRIIYRANNPNEYVPVQFTKNKKK